MKKQLNSFKYALKGLGYTVATEGHFRFHLVAAAYVIFFAARFYSLTKGEWAALITLLVLVLSLEMLNTALERICNRVSPTYDPLVRVTKDVAAGAVFVAAVASIGVAFVLFFDVGVFKTIFDYFLSHPLSLGLLLLSAAAAILFIVLTPKLVKIKK